MLKNEWSFTSFTPVCLHVEDMDSSTLLTGERRAGDSGPVACDARCLGQPFFGVSMKRNVEGSDIGQLPSS